MKEASRWVSRRLGSLETRRLQLMESKYMCGVIVHTQSEKTTGGWLELISIMVDLGGLQARGCCACTLFSPDKYGVKGDMKDREY